MAGRTFKKAVFADDILLTLSDSLTSILALLTDFAHYKNLSNIQINFAKFSALNVTLTAHKVKTCKASFPFVWQNQSITYIGIQLPTSLSDLYTLNYLPLLRKIQSDLQTLHKGLFSWFGWAPIIKMNVLPRLLYVLQTVPI